MIRGMSGTPPRGTVTFLFSDIEASSDLVRRLGNDDFAAVRADHRGLLRGAFDAHGGQEIDTAGDGFFVAFDSAREAVAAAVDAQRSVAAHAWPTGAELRVRIGLHTAEPHLGEDGYIGIGVHRASRICDAARGGQILVSNATAGIIEDAALDGVSLVDLGTHRLKGFPGDQRLFQVTVEGLASEFDLPRTDDAGKPGVGTFVLSDLAGFGRLIPLLGDEDSESFVDDYALRAAVVVEANDGIVLERSGDTVVAVFASAGAAVRAALAIRTAVSELRSQEGGISVAITLHSGRWSGDPRRVTAPTALRRLGLLSREAEPAQILLSQTTAALLEGELGAPELRDLGERPIRNLEEPVRLYELA
jgi:class 3 adenylate cyclase